ncbi:DnaT-like ssDNA-binding protein [Alcaligenes faecalis]|uniref:DnaT-like ssDNA-binding protein n=1 Tax=Alcaligenes faecalis TaxID=511 RepID=UPI0005AA61E9|nr:DnaT-like ssDNA-binding protein [Alcaligenes faecalis]ATH99537.1 hypothetical protein CPY64_07250 [Alcaligenes faecalis]AYZ92324.1 hypothetical protein EGY22_13020 [Alcaligenes faecalis]MCX5593060.1 hypothetical protein [Alcaligenes faecalis]QQC31876.1 hypothetical protein I6H81_14660 [Alcaligenes faecalis]CAJ0903274.1 Structural protein [Alcaligenes faecalis subsp. faecalis]
MSLVVEDGAGLPDADSYVSVSDADSYAVAMGHVSWLATGVTEAQKETALRRATQYVDSRYRYKNSKLNPDQALEWPRVGFPWPVKRVTDATCELAVRALSGALYADVAPEDNIKSETVGPLTTVYQDAENGGQVRFAIVDDLLLPLVVSGQMTTIRLERA